MSVDPFDLTGRVAIVTGSTRGIGLGIVESLCRAGAKCVISSDVDTDVRRTSQRLNDMGHNVLGVTCNVANSLDQSNLIETAIKNFGRIDILVCNAGITGNAGPSTALKPTDYLNVFDINLHSMVELTNTTYPIMKKQKSGTIILTSSIAGLRGNSAINAYALAKAGVAQLARNLAVQWGPDGIRANSVSPGFIRTQFSVPLMNDEKFMNHRMRMTPLRRVGEIEDVAGCVHFLASDAANFITGHNLIVDGGTTITDGS